MEHKGNTMEKEKTVPLFRSTRIIHYFMMFMASTLQYSLRYSLNMSIVCMVVPPQQQQLGINTTGYEENHENSTNNVTNSDISSLGEESVNSLCRVDTGKRKAFGYEGEFLWSRQEVGYALASFFYGYIPMQVI